VALAATAVDVRRTGSYERHRPETTTLYAVVRDNVETLYAAVAGGFEGAALPPFVRRELEGWAELLRRTFAVDVETCPRCGGPMRLLAVITDLTQVARFLRHRREPPARAPPRDPPYFKTLVVRRRQPTETSTQRELFEEH
jgi:hypothetical protein